MGRLSPSATGALSELRACAYLMADGYYVFRCESPSAPFDLVAYRGGTCCRVEVKSISQTAPYSPTISWPTNDEWDLLIAVDHARDRLFRFTRDMSKDDVRIAIKEAYGFPANLGWSKGLRSKRRPAVTHPPQIPSQAS